MSSEVLALCRPDRLDILLEWKLYREGGAAGDTGGMKEATMITVTIPVREIHCGGCENTIRVALSRMEGVRGVEPDHRTNQVRVSYDEARVGEVGLREALAALGFEPTAA
ncbi:MAG TPA: hypothetical protein DHU96_21935 [Actinobacteria bacterium]|nr:hypothetical protein [Actinomycetota bacterium]